MNHRYVYPLCECVCGGCPALQQQVPWFRLPKIKRMAPEFYLALRQYPSFYHAIAAYLRHGDVWRYACRVEDASKPN